MMGALGNLVVNVHRVAVGSISIDTPKPLSEGQWRLLETDEMRQFIPPDKLRKQLPTQQTRSELDTTMHRTVRKELDEAYQHHTQNPELLSMLNQQQQQQQQPSLQLQQQQLLQQQKIDLEGLRQLQRQQQQQQQQQPPLEQLQQQSKQPKKQELEQRQPPPAPPKLQAQQPVTQHQPAVSQRSAPAPSDDSNRAAATSTRRKDRSSELQRSTASQIDELDQLGELLNLDTVDDEQQYAEFSKMFDQYAREEYGDDYSPDDFTDNEDNDDEHEAALRNDKELADILQELEQDATSQKAVNTSAFKARHSAKRIDSQLSKALRDVDTDTSTVQHELLTEVDDLVAEATTRAKRQQRHGDSDSQASKASKATANRFDSEEIDKLLRE
jgi:hypothetical protein